MAKNPQIDAYIAKQKDFARPILEHIRQIIHTAGPEVSEVLKWNCPAFEYHGVLCGMAGFKEHCRFMLWKWALIVEHGGMDQLIFKHAIATIRTPRSVPNYFSSHHP